MKEKTISLLGISKRVILCRINELGNNFRNVMLQSINEKEEKHIELFESFNVEYKNKEIVIPAKDIYLYGEVNLSNEDDLDIIKKFELINHDGNNKVRCNFDYDKGTFTTIDKMVKETSTIDPVKWFKYNHCLIGKPERIVIYKLPKFKMND